MCVCTKSFPLAIPTAGAATDIALNPERTAASHLNAKQNITLFVDITVGLCYGTM
jgi:hypothetical protein